MNDKIIYIVPRRQIPGWGKIGIKSEIWIKYENVITEGIIWEDIFLFVCLHKIMNSNGDNENEFFEFDDKIWDILT